MAAFVIPAAAGRDAMAMVMVLVVLLFFVVGPGWFKSDVSPRFIHRFVMYDCRMYGLSSGVTATDAALND